MTCPYCDTKLPVDSVGQKVTCSKCGTELIVREFKATKRAHAGMLLLPVEHPVYGEDERYDNPTNY